jgi:hypothetical protein
MGSEESTTENRNGTTPTTSTTESQTSTTASTEGLPEGVKAEDDGNVVIIGGKRFVVQDKVNALVGDARKEGKTTGMTEAQKAAERQREADEAANLQEQGQFKTLYESEKTARQNVERELETVRNDFANHKLESVRKDVASRFGIPVEQAHRIAGSTQEDMEKDAAELAKIVKPVSTEAPKVPDTQTGHAGEIPPIVPKVEDPKKPKQPYAFQSKNEVSW